MRKTWMPMTAGILDIISGSFGLLGVVILVVLVGTLGSGILGYFDFGMRELPPAVILALFSAIAVPLIIIAILAIVGGVYALQRKIWGLALAGSIAAFFLSWLLGIAAIVLTSLSKSEFE